MKRFIVIFASVALFVCLLSCGYRGTYDDGYEDGYDEGYFYAMIKFEDYYDRGYENGYDEGYWEGSQNGWIDHIEEPGRYLEEEAVHYARQYSEWHPEEAMTIIHSYQSREPIDGTLPSYEEYLEAIESLYRFYEYFYCAMYD